MRKKYMAIDQYGNTYHNLECPRRDLCNRLGRTHADKMYIHDNDGNTYHIGYIIGGLSLQIYEITPVLNPLN